MGGKQMDENAPGRRLMPLAYDTPELADITHYSRASFIAIRTRD